MNVIFQLNHDADARLIFTAPQSDTYTIHLGDIQNAGGADHAYRLQLDRPIPDYELRIVPSNLNGIPGTSVPFTVYALRKNGFNGAIDLTLNNRVEGLRLDGARIPAGHDEIELTITLPSDSLYVPEPLDIEGRAVIDEKPANRPAVPAEDMMQAFIYHHLVPVDELLFSSIESSPRAQSTRKGGLLKLNPGKSTTLTFDSPTEVDRSQVSLKVESRNLPAGVKLEEALVGNGSIAITLSTDSATSKGLEGNLLFDLFVERTKPGSNQKMAGAENPSFFLPAPYPPYRLR